jgi:hypothetical protein
MNLVALVNREKAGLMGSNGLQTVSAPQKTYIFRLMIDGKMRENQRRRN